MEKNMVEKYMKELGYEDYEVADFAEACIRQSWPRGYNRWKVLKPVLREVGWDLSTKEGYAKYWAPTVRTGAMWDGRMRVMGIKEIKDIPTLGRIFKHQWNEFLSPTEIVEESPDRCVLRTLWCSNPFYGPSPYGRHDCIRSYMEYYRNADGGMTRDSALLGLAIHAKRRGLREDIEIEMPWAICRDGDVPYCLYIFRKKGSPKYEPPALTDRQKAWFIEDEVERSGEKPVVHVAKMLGITIEEFAARAFPLVVSLDIGAYMGWEQQFGKEKALDMYKKYWFSLLFHWVREAKLDLEIGRVTNLEELAKVITFCQKEKLVPYQIIPGGNGLVTLTTNNDPYAEIPTKVLGMKLGDSYFDAVASADEAFINQIIVETKMNDKAKASAKKRLVKGDDKNEIVIEKK